MSSRIALVWLATFCVCFADDNDDRRNDGAGELASVPDQYVLDYPTVERFCAPVRSTFLEATRTFSVVRGRRFRHAPNGGYGRAVADKVGTKNLLHVGADLGWYQVGEPVYAIANGVVRVSMAPTNLELPRDLRRRRNQPFLWGNLIVIEHRDEDGNYFTSFYGHLDTRRLVKVGDLVVAGQPIGTIGKQSPTINGGYKPHLHFGVREDRIGHTGMKLLPGADDELPVESLEEDRIVIDTKSRLGFLTFNGERYDVSRNADGKLTVPSKMLWNMLHPSFPIVGYAIDKEGFVDPIAFLRRYRANTNPAPFRN